MPHLDFYSDAFFGFAGILVGAIFAWFGKRKELSAGENKARLDATAAHVDRLDRENENLRSRLEKIEEETRQSQAEAYAMQDKARMALSMAVSHLVMLTGHINNRMPPPAPPIPDELKSYIHSLLLWSQNFPTVQPKQHAQPRDPPSDGVRE